jgi:type IV secretion system protein VirD4
MDALSQLKTGGLVIGMSQDGQYLYYIDKDTHSLIIGATRCGKTRCLVLPTIGLLALAGESIVSPDVKGELYCYTAPCLERLGYEVLALDFSSPSKSVRYNFCQPVIDAINTKNMSLAITRARDMATMLVPDGQKTEPIWIDGQRSALTSAILAVCVDNQDRPEYQNLSNAREFMAKMFRPTGRYGKLPLEAYMKDRPADHPVHTAMDIAQIAPSKMRGSFYTSALVTLDLFTNPSIHAMTNATDFDFATTGKNKRAIFIILPDEKSTYYPLAALFIYQQYQTLVEYCNGRGGRLDRRVNFVCDEFGNFVKIPDMEKLITVAGGRGMRFNLFLQDFNQLTEKYGEHVAKTIRSNCETWVYLQSDDPDTRRELSTKLDKYTIKSPSLSGSTGGNMSASYNYTGRDLLMPGEIGKINRPYQLVTSRSDPAIMYAPDLSKTIFNPIFGLGDEDHNRQVIMKRQARRPERTPEVKYWGIWDFYTNRILDSEAQTK